MKRGYFILVVLLIILAGYFFFKDIENSSNYTTFCPEFSNGQFQKICNLIDRIVHNRHDINEVGKIFSKNDSFDLYNVMFKGSDGKDIYGLFYFPLKKKFNVIIVLPAAAGTKESRGFYGEILTNLGYGALILDQRGIGETDGYAASLKEDFDAFLKKKEVYQFLMAKDVINAVDFVKNIKGVGEVGVLGESMGGRNAMIAAGLDKRIKSAIIISSAGYSGNFENKQVEDFISYINPNSYVKNISPRRILMLHAINDSVIPIADARYTFSLAKDPKKFIEFADKECKHGYCKPMHEAIKEELRNSFG